MWKLTIVAVMIVLAICACERTNGRPTMAERNMNESGEMWRAVPVGRLGLQVWRGEDHLFSLDADIDQPEGTRSPELKAAPTASPRQRAYEEDVYFYTWQDPEPVAGPLALSYQARQVDSHTLRLSLRCESPKELQFGGVRLDMPSLDLSYYLQGGRATAATAGGETAEFAIPHTQFRQPLGDQVQQIRLETSGGEQVKLEFSEPAAAIYHAHNLQIHAIQGPLAAGRPREFTLTVRLPEPVEFQPENQVVDTSDWFLYRGEQDFRPGSAIGMEDWLDTPAGKRGYVQIDEENARFAFEDGTPVKFWGTNISWADMARPEEEVVRYADKFAKHGANIVRFHKFFNFAPRGILDAKSPLQVDEEVTWRFDNMHAQLKERGIYVGWSPIAFMKFHEGFRDVLIDYDELKSIREAHPTWLGDTMYPFSTFAPDVQDLHIKLITNMLNHVNPHTGLRYADDPALAFVEFRNEESIFFWAVDNLAAESPLYRGLISEKFCDWLRERYPSEAALREGWTEVGLQNGESLEEGTIFPFPGWGRVNETPHSRRLIDSYRFLFEYQDAVHQRFARAVRETGYRGPLVGSCWQTADWLGHLYNLQSDRRVGFIDRHRYFGRGNRPLIGQPGYSLLGIGREVVSDRPFNLSEWAGGHVHAAELPPAIGFIGLGVQGWDSSNQFASNWWGIRTYNRHGINTTSDLFCNIGQFPFISRILHSGALREGEVVARRRVSMGDLYPLDAESADDFELMGGTSWDELERAVPREALGAGRVEVEFVDKPVSDKVKTFDLEDYLDTQNRIIHASNGQVVWDYGGRGFFTLDTEAGQAVVGFGGGGREHALADVSIAYDAPFANVYVVPRHPGETLENTRSLVVMVLGRTADQGDVLEETAMRPFRAADPETAEGSPAARIQHMLENPTLVFEPVRATLTLRRDEPIRVYALDHDGRLPAEPVEVPVAQIPQGQQFVLDGARYQTMYYLVEFEGD